MPRARVEHVALADRFTALFDTDGNGVIRLETKPIWRSCSLTSVVEGRAFSKHSVLLKSRPRRDEFIEFAQFLTVMNFLTNTEEGQDARSLDAACLQGPA